MSKKNILVIDDEQHIRDSLGFMLQRMGYEVRKEGDSTKVLDILMKERYDIVISDVTMPKLDGRELTRLLKEKYPDIYVILISGFSNEDDENDNGSNGSRPFFYLTKPFSMKDLIECLDQINEDASR